MGGTEERERCFEALRVGVVALWDAGEGGYTTMARNVCAALNLAGASVYRIEWGASDPPPVDVALHCVSFLQGYQPVAGALNVVYTMTESTRLPDHSVDTIRRYDRVIVPGEFNRQVFAQHGLRPQVMPLPYDDMTWPVLRDRKPRRSDEPIRFLCIAHGARKGAAEMVQAFAMAFDGDARVRLTLRSNGWTDWPGVDHMERVEGGAEGIRQLYLEADAYVLPSYGEGYSLTVLEALSTGLLPIVAANSAHWDFPDAMVRRVPCNKLIEARLVNPVYAGDMMIPDVRALADALVEARTNHAGYLRRAREGQRYLECYRLGHVGHQLRRMLCGMKEAQR